MAAEVASGSDVDDLWACSDLDDWHDLTPTQFGECFWMLTERAAVQWPRVLIPRCESMFAVTPYVAEFFSTVTALLFIILGVRNMLSSGHSDEVVDLACSVFVLNGVMAALSHGTQWRYFGQMDGVTINVMALFFCYAVMQAYFPSLQRRKYVRSFLLVVMMATMVTTLVWNGHSVPDPFEWTWHSNLVVMIGGAVLVFSTAMTYSQSKWHFGLVKRMMMLGSGLMTLGIICWVAEIFLPQCKHGTLIFSLHPLWHIFVALGLNMWICVCKFHRGHFYNFDVQVHGWLLFPRVVWAPKKLHGSHVLQRGAESDGYAESEESDGQGHGSVQTPGQRRGASGARRSLVARALGLGSTRIRRPPARVTPVSSSGGDSSSTSAVAAAAASGGGSCQWAAPLEEEAGGGDSGGSPGHRQQPPPLVEEEALVEEMLAEELAEEALVDDELQLGGATPPPPA